MFIFNNYFQKAIVEEHNIPVNNPGRGFYQIHTFDISGDVDIEGLSWSIDKKDSLAMAFVELTAFKSSELTEQAKENLSSILRFFSENGMDIIFRAVYDTSGNAFGSEPSKLSLVLSHYRDILEVLMRHRNSILVCQGFLIGNWGEMHGSRFMTKENLRTLYGIYREVTGGAIPLAVRQAVQWRIIHSPDSFSGMMGNTGIFDDAILAHPDHLGSFGSRPGSEAGWTDKWSMEEELTFISGLGDAMPFGGEAVCNDNYLPDEEEAVERLRVLKATYLNKIHHPAMIIDWKSRVLPDNGIFRGWGGQTLYDFIDAHLGYRFVIESLKVSKKNPLGRPVGIIFDIVIKNTGFARLYDSAKLELNIVVGGADANSNTPEAQHGEWSIGETVKQELPLIQPGGSATLRFETEPLKGDCYLNLRRNKDEAIIRFCNTQTKIPPEPTQLSYFEMAHYPGMYLGSIL